MCLMCEYYLEICSEDECVEAAKNRAIKDSNLREEHFESRSGKGYFLWRGYSEEPCEHMKKDHGSECTVVKKFESEYGTINDTCNCDNIDGEWVYY